MAFISLPDDFKLISPTLGWHHDRSPSDDKGGKHTFHMIWNGRHDPNQTSHFRMTVFIPGSADWFTLFQSFSFARYGIKIPRVSDKFIRWPKFDLAEFNKHLKDLLADNVTPITNKWRQHLVGYDLSNCPRSFHILGCLAKSNDLFIFPELTIHGVTRAGHDLLQVKIYPKSMLPTDTYIERGFVKNNRDHERKIFPEEPVPCQDSFEFTLTEESQKLWDKYRVACVHNVGPRDAYDQVMYYAKRLCGLDIDFDMEHNGSALAYASERERLGVDDKFAMRIAGNTRTSHFPTSTGGISCYGWHSQIVRDVSKICIDVLSELLGQTLKLQTTQFSIQFKAKPSAKRKTSAGSCRRTKQTKITMHM